MSRTLIAAAQELVNPEGGATIDIYTGLFIFVMAAFAGMEVIRRVPQLLHTPLMSLTNALSGIALVGSIVITGADYGNFYTTLGALAITASMINVVGGFWITDRMLKMFKPREKTAPAGDAK